MDADREPDSDAPWFEPKSFGYGAGLPIVWQGWALLGGFVAVVLLLALLAQLLARVSPTLALLPAVPIIILTLWFVRICERHTRGGWRWRWGKKD